MPVGWVGREARLTRRGTDRPWPEAPKPPPRGGRDFYHLCMELWERSAVFDLITGKVPLTIDVVTN